MAILVEERITPGSLAVSRWRAGCSPLLLPVRFKRREGLVEGFPSPFERPGLVAVVGRVAQILFVAHETE